MALARWTPMRNLASFQDEMNRMFNQFFRGSAGEEGSWGHSTWTPPVDIYETDDALVFQADLPGVAKDEVSIEVHNNTLILRGERAREVGLAKDAPEDEQNDRLGQQLPYDATPRRAERGPNGDFPPPGRSAAPPRSPPRQ